LVQIFGPEFAVDGLDVGVVRGFAVRENETR
jgi:hypothetical protein